MHTSRWLPFGLSVEQVMIWAIFFGLMYVLRDFFSIVFMTYIMSYVGYRIVALLTRQEGKSRLRKPVIAIVYATALAVGYLFAQSVFPLAVEQGKWLLAQINGVDLALFRDDLLAKTVGRLEINRFRDTPKYKADLEVFKKERARPLSFAEAKAGFDKIRNAFQESLLSTETATERAKLRQAPDVDEQYRRWLKVKVAEPELADKQDLRNRLYADFDTEMSAKLGTFFEKAKNDPDFQKDRHANAVKRHTEQLATERRERDAFEVETAKAAAARVVDALPKPERETRLRQFYIAEVPRLFPDFRLSFEEFRSLETIATEDQYRARFKGEDLDDAALEAKFAYLQQLKLGREHPMAKVVDDSSNLLRQQVPELTGWLTHAINNVLSFLLRALLSLGLSFMILWEIPHLIAGVASIAGTRLEPLFNEVAPAMARLGQVIGIAFSAQFLIASIDAALAFVALWWVGLGASAVFLSLLVLICCLVPYVGIFFAAVPVLLLAVKEGGLTMATKAAFALFLIHELEAWILSPKILGEFLRLSPIVIVLVLCIAQPLFGIWGLLLGVPVAVFLINDVLLQPRDDLPPPPPPQPAAPPAN